MAWSEPGHGLSRTGHEPSVISGLLAARARRTPTDVATSVHGGASLTFAEWERRSSAVARGLGAAGVRPGGRLALRLGIEGWLEFAVGYMAALGAGAMAVSMEGRWGFPDVERVVDHGSPAILLTAGAGALPTEATIAELEHVGARAPAHVRPAAAIAELSYRAGGLRPAALCTLTETDLMALAGLLDTDLDADPLDARWPRRPDILLHALPAGSRAASIAVLAALGSDRGRSVAMIPSARLGCLDVTSFRAALAADRPAAIAVTGPMARVLLASGALFPVAVPWLRTVVLDADPGAEILDELTAALPGAHVSVIERRARRGSPRPVVRVGTPETGSTSGSPSVAVELVPALTSQTGMVWHEQLAPGSFNLSPLVRRYRGDLDVGALEAALSDLVARHDALRATFRIVDGQLAQAVPAAAPVKLPMVDLSGWSDADAQAELARRIQECRTRPVSLAEGPLFHPCLVRLGPRDHVLIIRVHHAVFDDWSVGPFRSELASLYAAYRAGQPSPLPPLRTTFVEVCRRRQRACEGAAGQADRTFWARELEGAPVTLELPIGDPDVPRGTPLRAAAPVRIDIPAALLEELTALARRLRATVFMVMLAAFSVVVGRTCTAEDLVMSTLVADRDGADDSAHLGCFAKKVVVRISLAGDPSFVELVERARRAVLHAIAHKTLAFETVVQEHLDPVAAVHGLSARVSVKFQAAAAPTAPLRLPGLEVEGVNAARPIPAPHFLSRRDAASKDAPLPWGCGLYAGTFLEVSLAQSDGAAALVASGVFHGPAVRRLLDELLDVAGAATRDASGAISSLRAASEVAAADTVGPGAGRPGRSPRAVDLRGFTVDPARIEAALADCRGVAAVSVLVEEGGPGGRRLVARVLPSGDRPPTLDELRAHLWQRLPGYAWPAELVVTGASPGDARAEASDERAVLSALWTDAGGGERARESGNYWQVFSFVDALAEARRSGVAVADRMVMRNRTVRALAADLAAGDVSDRDGGAQHVTTPRRPSSRGRRRAPADAQS